MTWPEATSTTPTGDGKTARSAMHAWSRVSTPQWCSTGFGNPRSTPRSTPEPHSTSRSTRRAHSAGTMHLTQDPTTTATCPATSPTPMRPSSTPSYGRPATTCDRSTGTNSTRPTISTTTRPTWAWTQRGLPTSSRSDTATRLAGHWQPTSTSA